MTDTPEQAQLRRHLTELRQTAGAIGHDVALHVEDLKNIDEKIDRLGRLVGKQAKYAAWEIEDDLSAFGRGVRRDVRALPGAIASGASAAGSAVAGAVSSAASRTGEAIASAGHRASEGTKNALASAAGVKRTPMKEWHAPRPGSSSNDE